VGIGTLLGIKAFLVLQSVRALCAGNGLQGRLSMNLFD